VWTCCVGDANPAVEIEEPFTPSENVTSTATAVTAAVPATVTFVSGFDSDHDDINSTQPCTTTIPAAAASSSDDDDDEHDGTEEMPLVITTADDNAESVSTAAFFIVFMKFLALNAVFTRLNFCLLAFKDYPLYR